MERLRDDHLGIEVVQANYFEQASLDAAVEGIEGLLVLTTTGLPEEPAMSNLVAAIRKAGCLIHMLRVVGMQPDTNLRRIPQPLRDFGLGLEIQHPIARQVLDDAEMPVTYLNVGASYMDNFLRMIPPLQQDSLLPWPDRLVAYVDPREVGEAAARLILSDDARHVGQFYTLNNGEAPLRTSEVARMMSEVFLRRIRHDGSREALDGYFKPLVDSGLVPPGVPDYLWNFFLYEEANAPVWVPNQFLERTLGRKPGTLRTWLQEHRHHFSVEDKGAASAAPAFPATAPSSAIDGIWDCTVSTPVGKDPHELVMRSAPDGTLSGEMTNLKNGISMPLQNGRIDGDRLTWSMQLVKPFKVTLRIEVGVDGDQLTGQASAGMIGRAAIRGTRRT
ncbi:NmrA family NAD(P)-binding protein [Azospirillum sp. B506]|uniref:NmrA family NAD(P)-binding protein n=1 Tax=Azospirillum sp. B506 TaxID=137721 RepID=UPI00034B9492|nr:NmrA family NAD(P)-binding protein [Azospirillum sp. B506]